MADAWEHEFWFCSEGGDPPEGYELPWWAKETLRERLFSLVSIVYGDGTEITKAPFWCAENDTEFLEYEEERRELPYGALRPLEYLPYMEHVETAVYKAGGRGKETKVDAHLFGTGERLGEWDAFTLFLATPGSKFFTLMCGQAVVVGTLKATVIRILRGSKKAGATDSGKTQNCYFVLLAMDHGFRYAALQHVKSNESHSNNFHDVYGCEFPLSRHSYCYYWVASDLHLTLVDHLPMDGYASSTASTLLEGFTPKTPAAVARAASTFVASLTSNAGDQSGARGRGRGRGCDGGGRGGGRAKAAAPKAAAPKAAAKKAAAPKAAAKKAAPKAAATVPAAADRGGMASRKKRARSEDSEEEDSEEEDSEEEDSE